MELATVLLTPLLTSALAASVSGGVLPPNMTSSSSPASLATLLCTALTSWYPMDAAAPLLFDVAALAYNDSQTGTSYERCSLLTETGTLMPGGASATQWVVRSEQTLVQHHLPPPSPLVPRPSSLAPRSSLLAPRPSLLFPVSLTTRARWPSSLWQASSGHWDDAEVATLIGDSPPRHASVAALPTWSRVHVDNETLLLSWRRQLGGGASGAVAATNREEASGGDVALQLVGRLNLAPMRALLRQVLNATRLR